MCLLKRVKSIQPKGSTGAQLHVRDLYTVVDATYRYAFFVPVELECFAKVELQGHECLAVFARAGAPSMDEVCNAGVATKVTVGLDLHEQRTCRTPITFWAQTVGFEGKLQFVSEVPKLVKPIDSDVFGYLNFL
jgi:hypothetical protein